jgi:valyl-tRNA synthetase
MCDGKNHHLKEIFRAPESPYDTEYVVRWCSECGAIVVDIDIDNRTSPGAGRKMEFPTIAKERVRKPTPP